MAYEIFCKHCGKKVLKYENWEKKYRSPIATCKKCGKEYLDPRCHELAVTGIPGDEFNVSSDLILLIIGGLITWRGCYLFGVRMLGTPDSMQWLLPSTVLLLGLAIVLCALVDGIRILTGLKRRKFEKLLEESQNRMKVDNYVQRLKELGYLG